MNETQLASLKRWADQFQCHAASQWLDQIELAGQMMSGAAAEIERLSAALAEAIDQQMHALDLVSRIRWALGDKGLRMQDELIEHCKVLAALMPNEQR